MVFTEGYIALYQVLVNLPMEPTKMKNKYVIVRTYSAGVHAGTLVSYKGTEATLNNARRIWYWKGAFTLNEIANKGIGEGSKLSDVVPKIILTQAVEIIPCTKEAQKNLSAFLVFTP